jgi:hypothetical protein
LLFYLFIYGLCFTFTIIYPAKIRVFTTTLTEISYLKNKKNMFKILVQNVKIFQNEFYLTCIYLSELTFLLH